MGCLILSLIFIAFQFLMFLAGEKPQTRTTAHWTVDVRIKPAQSFYVCPFHGFTILEGPAASTSSQSCHSKFDGSKSHSVGTKENSTSALESLETAGPDFVLFDELILKQPIQLHQRFQGFQPRPPRQRAVGPSLPRPLRRASPSRAEVREGAKKARLRCHALLGLVGDTGTHRTPGTVHGQKKPGEYEARQNVKWEEVKVL